MKKQLLKLGILGFAAMTILWGCGGDDNGGGGTPTQPSFEEIEIPQGLQDAALSDPNAAMALSYLQLANSFALYGTYFQPPSKAYAPTKAGAVSDTTSWSYEGITIDYYNWEDSENYYWEIFVTNEIYTDCKFIEYVEAKDGRSGYYQLFSDCGAEPVFVWNWTLSALDVFTLTMTSDSESIEVVVNPDGSGVVTVYYGGINSQPEYVIMWNANGSGSYTEYSEGGSITDSGTWDAA